MINQLTFSDQALMLGQHFANTKACVKDLKYGFCHNWN